jgi:hypothetical protein
VNKVELMQMWLLALAGFFFSAWMLLLLLDISLLANDLCRGYSYESSLEYAAACGFAAVSLALVVVGVISTILVSIAGRRPT